MMNWMQPSGHFNNLTFPWRTLIALCTCFYCLPATTSNACGPYDFSFKGYSFLSSDILLPTEMKPEKLDAQAVYNVSPGFPLFVDGFRSVYNTYFQGYELMQHDQNVAEWNTRICENALPEDIKEVIYQTSKETLELLRTATLSRSMQVPYPINNNTFAKYLKRQKCTETVEYLLYAKECEPHVIAGDPWEETRRNVDAMENLIKRGKGLFKDTKSQYLRLRYAYQLVRLAHYAGLHQQALELYDFLMPKLDLYEFDGQPSLIYYWVLGHRAGALQALDNYPEAAYLYSLIYAHCPSKRVSAFRSFKIRSDEEWKAALRLCQTDTERATLFAMRAGARDSRALEEMQEIYRLDPKNPFLEVLLVKEIQELEEDLLGVEFNDNRRANDRYHDRPRRGAGDYIIELHQFTRELREAERVARPELWHLAEGYLELIAGDYYAALNTFNEAALQMEDQKLIDQLNTFRLAAEIGGMEVINDSTEQLLFDLRKDNPYFRRQADFPDFFRDKLAALYREFGRPGMAFRCHYGLDDLQMSPQVEIIEDLIKVCEDPDRNSLEWLLTTTVKGKDMLPYLYDLKATLLFQDYQLEAAYEVFEEIPINRWDEFGLYDPFKPTVHDCIHCPQPIDTSRFMNKGEIMWELMDLEYKAKADIDNKAKHYFKIGVALYNMTFFGHSWRAMDYYRSGGSWDRLGEGEVFSVAGSDFRNREIFNIDRPLYYFEKARLQAGDNKELAASATFYAAKCELIQYYRSDAFQEPGPGMIPMPTEDFLTNYQRLKADYSDTEFYQEIIEECLYFRAYAIQ